MKEEAGYFKEPENEIGKFEVLKLEIYTRF